jgi:hypothetical protein
MVQSMKFVEGSVGHRAAPPPPRRSVPEPRSTRPAPAPLPIPVAAKPAPKADIIPITRARTTPPKSFEALAQPPMHLPPEPVMSAPRAPRAATPLPLPPPEQVMPVVTGKARWATFVALGLGPPAEVQKQDLKTRAAKHLVTTYRALGFGILSLIVIVLVGYIFTSGFYFLSDSWIEPMVVSKSDERVVAMQAQVAEQQNTRDRIAADLNAADREIAVQQAFQAEFAAAIRADLQGRKDELDRVRDLAKQYAGARQKIQRSNAAYASSSRKKMAEEYAAGLIDRSDMLSGKYQLAQITTSSLSLAERQAEYQGRADELEGEAASLEGILDEQGGVSALSYDVLKIKQEYEISRLESAKAIENREALAAALERQDQILEGLRSSPYMRAVADNASVAFVPYANLKNVKAGSALYSCALEMVLCSKVGKVLEVLPGEVTAKHPHRDKMLRGQLVEVQFSDSAGAREDVLFVGGRPLFL